ncbi:MAG TPA: amidohydrolase family protein [Ferruginibacter sp.]|nr:amidohydrolase family protein [Ferruginibacter sp.]HRE64181.1 amidohydrolase family protein [Ferruginibacter sp.]
MYRKYKPSQLFTGTQMLNNHVLLCKPDGSIEAIVKEEDAGDQVQILDGILCPGFVNAHCHIELSHLKALIPIHTGLPKFIEHVMSIRHQHNVEEKLGALQAAQQELFESGTVAVGDICNTTDSIAIKKNSPLYWHNFIELTGFVDTAAQSRLAAGEAILQHFEQELSKYPFNCSLVPHAPYSVSKNLFELLNQNTAGKIISIHNQETPAEDKLFKNKSGDFLAMYQHLGIDISGFNATGKSSLQSWLPYFGHQQKIISVHNSFTSQADIDFAGQQLLYCLCPNANLYIENVLPPIELLIKNNCPIVLGTDSYASNLQLNMMAEINTIQKHFPQIAIETILQWATINGAKALGIDDRFGNFEKGKNPGMVLIKDGVAKRIA